MTVISIPDKRTVPIPGGGVNGPWRTQGFVDPAEPGVEYTSFTLGDWTGRGTVHLQGRIKMVEDEFDDSNGDRLWPEWLEVQLVRAGEDPTGDETKIVPHKRNWGFLYTAEMDFDPKRPLSIQMRHNGSVPVDRLKAVLKIAPKVTEVVAR